MAGRWLASAALALGAAGAAQAQSSSAWQLDPTFHFSKEPENQGTSVIVQRDGMLWINAPGGRIVRLDARNGAHDLTLRGNSGVYDLALQADGKLLAVGHFTEFPTGQAASRIVRLNADGTRDASFTPPSPIYFWLTDLAVQDDGKILIGGNFTELGSTAIPGGLARLNPDGSHDTSYQPALPSGRAIELLPLPGGQLLVRTSDDSLYWLNSDGSLNHTGLAQPDDSIFSLYRLRNGQILVAGAFTKMGGRQYWGLARLNADGSLDASFPNPSITGGYVHAMLELPTGQILLGGSFKRIHGQDRKHLALLNADGTLDDSFSAPEVNPNPIDTRIWTLVQQADGKVLVGGEFYMEEGGHRRQGVVRLKPPVSHSIAITADPPRGGQPVCQPNPVPRGGNTSCYARPNEALDYVFTGFTGDCTGHQCDFHNVTSDKTVVAHFAKGHRITQVVQPAGKGWLRCPTLVLNGQSASCNPLVDVGYKIERIEGCDFDASTGLCRLSNVTAPRTVTMFLRRTHHHIVTNVQPAASGAVLCDPDPVPDGSSSRCTANAFTGYVFDHFSGDCASATGNVCQLTNVTDKPNVVAHFRYTGPSTHAITATVNPSAGGSVTCTPNPVPHGGGSTCTASANSGYTFVDFSGDCTGASCTLTNVTSPKSVTANFRATATATVSASVLGGHGTVAPASRTVNVGDAATFTLAPDAGYVPSSTVGGNCGTGSFNGNDYTVASVSADCALEFSFQATAPGTHAITATASPAAGGSVTCAPNPVPNGGNVSCTASANPGYAFDGFGGDCSGNTCQLTNVTGPKSVTARFRLIGTPPSSGFTPVPTLGHWALMLLSLLA
ncbi:MAG: hypothetical protein Q4A97_11395, partial [Comamonadaceae bacterium]|nr:hypothetical protein [Comamonadaceae bacterium]